MNDLEMCKAMAKLEGVAVTALLEDGVEFALTYSEVDVGCLAYNPITDLALNCALRDKYKHKVSIQHWNELVYVESSFDGSVDYSEAGFKGGKSICRAVIKCILKANGVYK